MLLFDFIKWARSTLQAANIASSNLDIQIICCDFLQLSKEDYFFKAAAINLSEHQILDLKRLIIRRSNSEPVSHIINKREFYGLDFFVNKYVLDPRPDSELLVEETINIINRFSHKISMAEIGVGTGCLSIAIAKNSNNINDITAIDISDKALEICKGNAKYHNIDHIFDFINCDLLTGVSAQKKFDVIISNPPYIRSDDISKLQTEVKDFEPITALDGGEDGLDFYRIICRQAKKFIKSEGFLVFEIGFDQRKEVESIMSANNYINIRYLKDLANNDRIIIANNH